MQQITIRALAVRLRCAPRDLELEQALIRVVLGGLLSAYVVVQALVSGHLSHVQQGLLTAVSVFLAGAVVLLLSVFEDPGERPWRRYAGIMLDLGATTVGMILGGKLAAPLYGVYLWVIVGNGFRYGLPYLKFSVVLSLVGFVSVTLVGDFWRHETALSVGLILTLVAVPPYLALMLARMQELTCQITESARRDPLTGTLNRRALFEELPREIARARRGHRPLSVLIADLDHFKRVNDTYGHQAGDEALVAFAAALQNGLRAADRLARYGGEEFVVVLPETGPEEARVVAERLRKAVAAVRLAHGDATIAFTASFGVVGGCPTADDPEALIGQADRALYQAKDGGRNRVALAVPLDLEAVIALP